VVEERQVRQVHEGGLRGAQGGQGEALECAVVCKVSVSLNLFPNMSLGQDKGEKQSRSIRHRTEFEDKGTRSGGLSLLHIVESLFTPRTSFGDSGDRQNNLRPTPTAPPPRMSSPFIYGTLPPRRAPSAPLTLRCSTQEADAGCRLCPSPPECYLSHLLGATGRLCRRVGAAQPLSSGRSPGLSGIRRYRQGSPVQVLWTTRAT
jgi:hypothetical protein